MMLVFRVFHSIFVEDNRYYRHSRFKLFVCVLSVFLNNSRLKCLTLTQVFLYLSEKSLNNINMNVPALIVQYLMKNRAVSEKNLKDFVHQVNPNEPLLDMKQILEGIRSKLNIFNLTIELIRCELTGVKFFVCLSTVERECLAEFPVLSKEEEDCMFAIVDEIMNNNGSPISSNDAINIIMALEQSEMIRPDKAIDILKSFVSKNILVEKKDGFYLLGPLVLTSLRFYLSSNANAKVCALCTKDVVYSKSCHLCDANMHYYCFKGAQDNVDSSRCPICQR